MKPTDEEVRVALQQRLKSVPLTIQTTMKRSAYSVEGMNVERRIHQDQARKLQKTMPVMCRHCAHSRVSEKDLPDGDEIYIFNGVACDKANTFTCPDGLHTESGKWAVPTLKGFIDANNEPMLIEDRSKMRETIWPPTDAALSAGFMNYVSPDEVRAWEEAKCLHEKKPRSATPKTVDGDIW